MPTTIPPGVPGTRVLAATDIIDWTSGIVTRVENLLPAVAILLVGIAALRIYHRTQGSLVAVGTTLLIGGAIVWAIANVTWFQNSVGGIFNAPAPHRLVQLHPGRPGPGLGDAGDGGPAGPA